MKRFFFFIIVWLLSASSLYSQMTFSIARDSVYLPLPDQRGNLGLHQSLLDASTGFTLMSVAAHPDDEDIFSITYFRRKYGVRAVVVVSNRGEGGQNEIGPELYTDLAVVRSHEMAAAERISGSEYYNLNFVDFGYTKNIRETFDRWGKEELLKRLVRMIRLLRPQVIITNHDVVSGHGNHRAVGWAVRQAFQQAADPAAFPEQLKNGLRPWQPLRLFQRLSGRNAQQPADMEYDVGEFSPFWGMSYAEIAKKALAQHRSQGFDKFARTILPGPRKIRYKLVAEARPEFKIKLKNNLFSGLPDPLRAILQKSGSTGKKLETLRQEFRQFQANIPGNPSDLAEKSLTARQLVEKLLQENTPSNAEGRQTLKRFAETCNRIATLALGIQIAVHHKDDRVTPGDTLRSELLIWNTGAESLQILEVSMDIPGSQNMMTERRQPLSIRRSGLALEKQKAARLLPQTQIKIPFRVSIPEKVQFTEPESRFVYSQFRQKANCFGRARIQWKNQTLTLKVAAPVKIAPQILLQPPAPRRMFVAGRTDPLDIPIVVYNYHQQPVKGQVNLRDENGYLIATSPFELDRQETFAALRFRLPAAGSRQRKLQAEALISPDNHRAAVADISLKPIALEITPNVRVGIVQSYDPTLLQALQQMQVQAQTLSRQDLLWGDLSQFDVILIDIRAYLVRQDLRAANGRLLKWVHDGGRLVVMYHKVFEWDPEFGNPAFAPYPLHLGRQRVTDENARVKVLLPDHPLLNRPNRITEADWQGWVQERGLYFPDKVAPEYQRLLAMHDPGEKPPDTSLLVASYGKGQYIYTSLVWYRQLRALVPGGFRMLANFVSWKKPR